MRSICGWVSIRAVLSAMMVVALAGAAADEFSRRVVNDAKAATITGGGSCGNSTIMTNGTISCLTSSCPQANYTGGGTGNNCVQNQSCGDCQCTYSGPICNGD